MQLKKNQNEYLIRNEIAYIKQFFWCYNQRDYFDNLSSSDIEIDKIFYKLFPEYVDDYFETPNNLKNIKWCERIRNNASDSKKELTLFFDIFDKFMDEKCLTLLENSSNCKIKYILDVLRIRPGMWLENINVCFLYQYLYGYSFYVSKKRNNTR